MAKRPWVELPHAVSHVSARTAGAGAEGGASGLSGRRRGGEESGSGEVRSREMASATKALLVAAGQLEEVSARARAAVERELAGLSVAIARKVLAAEIEKGHYRIEAIVNRLLAELPSKGEVVVRLNPGDLAACRKVWSQTGELDESAAAVQFVGDSALGPAECVLETSAGLVEATIRSQLARIEEAFRNEG